MSRPRAAAMLAVCLALLSAGPAMSAGIKMSVLNFDDLASDSQYPALGKALSEMALADLSRISGLVLVERQDMERVMRELALGLTGATAEETAPKVGRLLGAGYLLAGNYLVAKGKVAISYKLVEVETARIVCAGSVEGRPDDVLKVSASLTSSVAAKLKEAFPSLGAMSAARARPQVPVEQVDRYGQALDLADNGDYVQAKAVLKGVLGAHPKFDYGAQALIALERRIAEYDRERQRRLDEQRKKPLTWQSFIQLAGSYQSSQQYSSLLDLCRQFSDRPPQSPQGETLTPLELVGYYTVFSLYSLRRWDQAIPEAEKFLKEYPSSAYYQTVRGFLTQAMSETQTLAARLAEADRKSVV